MPDSLTGAESAADSRWQTDFARALFAGDADALSQYLFTADGAYREYVSLRFERTLAYYDADGVCRLEPYQEPSAAIIDWRYGTTDLFLPEKHPGQDWSDETDIFDAPNVFVVTCNNPDMDAAMVATAVNDNPASKKSTFKRGMRITSVERVDNIASQEDLQAYANKRRNESLLATRTITFYTLAEPGHGVGDILALTHDEIGGIYLETGWSVTMQPGSLMTHSAKRTVIA